VQQLNIAGFYCIGWLVIPNIEEEQDLSSSILKQKRLEYSAL
jgi:hypothetical protein